MGISKNQLREDMCGSSSPVINVFVLCYNNCRQVKLCVDSIRSRTTYPYRLILVDNASDDKMLHEYYSSLEGDEGDDVAIVRNSRNLWVLGLNVALRRFLELSDEVFVVTDSDIIVPLPNNGVCWLRYLYSQLNANPVIGKLGLQLDLGWIKSRANYYPLYERELAHQRGISIGDNVIAPVDTTLAMYRYDYFVTSKPRFYPGHGALARPYYYCCRSSLEYSCKHLSWRDYFDASTDSIATRISKCICFSLMGAYLDPLFLATLPLQYIYFYKFIKSI